MIITIDTEKAFEKIQDTFMIKNFEKLGIKGTFFNLIKSIYRKPTDDILFSNKRLNAFPLKLGIRQEYPL